MTLKASAVMLTAGSLTLPRCACWRGWLAKDGIRTAACLQAVISLPHLLVCPVFEELVQEATPSEGMPYNATPANRSPAC